MAKGTIYGKKLEDFKVAKFTMPGATEPVESRVHHWLCRAEKMKIRRSFFENMWRDSLFAFAAFAVNGTTTAKNSFDSSVAPELQAYFNNKFTSSGFRFTDMRYPLEFAVVMRKLATEIKNLPVPDWAVLNSDDQSPAILWKHVYLQACAEAGAEYEDFETWLQKNIFGTSIRWSRLVSYTRSSQEPTVSESGQIAYTTTQHNVRDFKSTTVDLRHVLLDEGCRNSDLSDCEDAIVFEYYSKDQGQLIFGDVDFTGLGIAPMARNNVFQDINDLNGGDAKEVYEVMNCYNQTRDEYCLLINGVEVRRSPIPMKSFNSKKEIPLALFVDHKIPGQPYGYGEPAIVKAFREIKNKNRNLIYDVTKKAAKPTLAIDPLSTFQEETYTWGQDFVRVAPGDMTPIPVEANLDAPLRLDEMTDNDIIIATGVNILSTANPDHGETATKTVVRKESEVLLIDLGLHFNSITGLSRLHRINANILQLHLKTPVPGGGERKVTTEGKQIFRSQLESTPEKFLEEDSSGVHTLAYKGEDIDYEFKPIIKLGNIAVSEQLQKNVEMEGVELLIKAAPEAVDQLGLGEFIRERHNFPESVLKKSEDQGMPGLGAKTEEDTVNELIKQAGGVLPEDQQAINQYKNAKNDQQFIEEAERPEAMAAEGGATSPPASVGL